MQVTIKYTALNAHIAKRSQCSKRCGSRCSSFGALAPSAFLFSSHLVNAAEQSQKRRPQWLR